MNKPIYLSSECPYCKTIHNLDMRLVKLGTNGLNFLAVTCVNCKKKFYERLVCSTESDGTPQISVLRTIRPAWVERFSNRAAVKYGKSKHDRSRVGEPPKVAEFLIYLLLSRQDRVNILGDLMEDYGTIENKFSRSAAILWYYKQVFASIPKCVWKSLFRWGTIAAVGDWIRRHT